MAPVTLRKGMEGLIRREIDVQQGLAADPRQDELLVDPAIVALL